VAVRVEHLDRKQRLLEPDGALDAIRHRELGGDRHGVADALLDGRRDLAGEPGAVLDRSAVLVVTLVDPRRHEGAHQVEVPEVELDRVESSLHGDLGRVGELPRGHCDVRLRDAP
jgi:hypothetical protein